jgi:hypothetical protein
MDGWVDGEGQVHGEGTGSRFEERTEERDVDKLGKNSTCKHCSDATGSSTTPSARAVTNTANTCVPLAAPPPLRFHAIFDCSPPSAFLLSLPSKQHGKLLHLVPVPFLGRFLSPAIGGHTHARYPTRFLEIPLSTEQRRCFCFVVEPRPAGRRAQRQRNQIEKSPLP